MEHPIQRAVVTGGAGFIGANLVAFLREEGVSVEVVDTFVGGRFEERLQPGVPVHEVDIRDQEALVTVFAGADVVFHLAALPRVQDSIDQPVKTHEVNVSGTLQALEAARRAGVGRFVFASSAAVYGEQSVMPLTEDMRVQPKSPYGLHKYVGEHLCRQYAELYDLPTVSLRFFNVYGPYFDPTGPYALVVGKFLLALREGKPLSITGDGTHTRDYVHVHDVVQGLFAAAREKTVGRGEVCNLGSGVETSVNELAGLIGGEVTYIPPRVEPARFVASIAQAKELLGWEPRIVLSQGITDLKRGA